MNERLPLNLISIEEDARRLELRRAYRHLREARLRFRKAVEAVKAAEEKQ